MCDDMIYCGYCQQYYRKDYVHICSFTSWYCSGCGCYVYGNHMCPGTVTYSYSTPFDKPSKYYKCPKCKGEFSEPFKKFTGKYKEEDIQEIGRTDIVVARQKVPVYKYVCPFCSKEMKGLN